MCHTGTNAVDHRFRRAPGNALPLHHRRHDRIEEDYFGDPRCSVARDVPGQFAAARRMPDQYCAAKIEFAHELGEIIGPRIDIVTGSRLIGRAVSPPVMGDGTVTFGIEKQHLCFPRRTGQWPAVRENNRRSGAPVTIVDCGTVTGLDCRHGISPLLAERPMQNAGHPSRRTLWPAALGVEMGLRTYRTPGVQLDSIAKAMLPRLSLADFRFAEEPLPLGGRPHHRPVCVALDP